jgi:copper(I)-binding protein
LRENDRRSQGSVMNRSAFTLFIFIGLALIACQTSSQADLVVTNIWGRPSPASAANAAFYMTIRNSGQVQDSLDSVEIDICDNTQLHETNIDEDGVMSMTQVTKIDIPGGETVPLEPGGLHVMCLGLKSALEAGEEIPITLSFAGSGEIQVQAEIREG